MKSRERADLEAEQVVRDRLYGRPAEVVAVPMPRGPRRTHPSAGAPMGGRAGGRYRFLEPVGGGGIATVYRALDDRLKREVAVKVIAERFAHDSRLVSRFRREAELCARLSHPHIVGILDAGVEPRDFIVMELVEGVDAGTLLDSNGPLAPEESVRLLTQVSEGLAHAHDRNVVHQDVTPGNILISRPDGRARLVGFGLASDPTDAYVAPEILLGAAPSPRSDLYSLGVVGYRLLTGPTGLPRVLTEALEQAVAPDPDARQGSVAEFRAQLELLAQTTPRGLSTAA